MGADHGRLKGRTGLLSFLEHNGDDVVPYVALPFHLHVSVSHITEKAAQTQHRAEEAAQCDSHNHHRAQASATSPLASQVLPAGFRFCCPCPPRPS